MSSILSIQETKLGNIIAIGRKATLEDCDVKYPSPDAERNKYSTYVSKGIVISLKPSVIAEMAEMIGVTIGDDLRLSDSGAFKGVTDHWKANPSQFGAKTELDVKYNGLRTNESKDKRYKDKVNELNGAWESQKQELTEKALEELNSAIEVIALTSQESMKERFQQIIVQQANIKKEFFDSALSDENKVIVANREAEIEDIDEQIKKLKEQKNANRKEVYGIKRQAVVEELRKTDSPIAQGYIDNLEETEKERVEDAFSLFS